MTPPFPIPQDVANYVDQVFLAANVRVSSNLHNVPNAHESSLDFLLIAAIAEFAAPYRTASQYVVNFGVHFVGGGNHVNRWEIADIGVVINYTRGGERVRTKAVLLQSKRLYPREVDFVEIDAIVKPGGYGGMALPLSLPAEMDRTFTFDQSCRYNALQVGDDQWQRINNYESQHSIPVHYLLYHPGLFPLTQRIPVDREHRKSEAATVDLGARVVRSSDLRQAASGLPRNAAPSFTDLRSGIISVGERADDIGFGWPIHKFMSTQAIECNEGYVASDLADEGLRAIFSQRSAPIAAAFRIDIEAPVGVQV